MIVQSAVGTASLIAIDWGTTNRRGFLIGSDGAVLDSRADGLGLANVEDYDFRSAFDAMIKSWTCNFGVLPALLSGMVGASTGWKEASYCSLPADMGDLAANLEPVSHDTPVWIVPGVAVSRQNEMPDVMRGEELQAIAAAEGGHSLIVLPGTHSKWVRIEDYRIVKFKTFMTGDLHAAVLNHTVVSTLSVKRSELNTVSFDCGIDVGRLHHSELTHVLFGARSRVLFDELAAENVSDYLSGLLIGAEIAAVSIADQSDPVLVVGDDKLSALYHRALTHCGIDARIADVTRIGETYWNIALRAGIVEA